MALRRINGQLALACFIFVIYVQLQTQFCEGLPAWADIGWKTNEVGRTLADTLKDRSRGSDGAVDNVNTANKFFRRLSKFGAAAGSFFALAGTVFSIFDDAAARKHKELLKEFSSVKNGLDNINGKMDKIIKVIKHEHAKTKGFQSFAKIEGAVLLLDNYNKYPEHYKTDLMRYLENNDMYNALIAIFKLVNDGDSIVKTLYQQTYGDLGAINDLRAYIEGLIYTGTAVQTTICQLDQMEEKNGKRGKSAKQAKTICYDVKGDDFDDREKTLNSMFNAWAAKAKENYKKNIQDIMKEEYDSNDFDYDNEYIAASIGNKLKSNYDWVDIMVGVYNPISGWDNHAINTDAHGFRDKGNAKNNGKNWFVMANDRTIADSTRITRSNLKDIVKGARRGDSVRHCRDYGIRGVICQVSMPSYDDAGSYLSNLKTRLARNNVDWFGLAVIKRYNGLHGAWTQGNAKKFFFFNFDEFTVIGGIYGTIL